MEEQCLVAEAWIDQQQAVAMIHSTEHYLHEGGGGTNATLPPCTY
jgi:hypothetical protein